MNTAMYHKKAYCFLKKRFYHLWDPDYTKLTPREKRKIKKAEKEIRRGQYFTNEDVWK